MRVLVGCEFSGRVRSEFRARGHDAWSCDILPAEDGSPHHFECDIREVVDQGWDMLIVFPPCTYLATSGLHHNKRVLFRKQKTERALDFVRYLLALPIERIALENPVGAISTAIRKPDQTIQPYEYGDDASKLTCLWLKNLPKLEPTHYVEPRIVNGQRRWANQRDCGRHHEQGMTTETRAHIKSITWPGIAKAMGEQWNFRS